MRRLVAGLLLVLAGLFLLQAVRPGSSSPIVAQGSVSILQEVDVRGQRQWVSIRGVDAANPLLLFLHGGPGSPVLPIRSLFSEPWEDDFVVVHWDQRGAGKSTRLLDPERNLTIDDYVADTIALSEWLRARFDRDRIVLAGSSWGSVLGLLAAQRRPDLYEAWIGTGQVVDELRSEQLSLEFVRARARELGRQDALDELAPLVPPYADDPRAILIQRRWLGEFGGSFRRGSPAPFLPDFDTSWVISALGSPEYSWLDLVRFLVGNSRSRWSMFAELKQVNLTKTVRRLDVPAFFLMGRHDWNTPLSLVEQFAAGLDAPEGKRVVVFERSAHTPFLEEPERFARELSAIRAFLEAKRGGRESPPRQGSGMQRGARLSEPDALEAVLSR